MNSGAQAILARLVLVLNLIITIHSDSANAGTLTIEGQQGLSVPIDFISKILPSIRFPEQVRGKVFIESKIVVPYQENSREDVVIAAIPGLLDIPTIDYLFRSTNECIIFITKSNGEIDWDRAATSFNCPPDTSSLVKERAICSSGGGTWDVAPGYPAGWECVPKNRRSCSARGGTMRRVCFSQVMTCIVPYQDAGQDCTDGSQCESRKCVDVGKKPSNDGTILGQCKNTDDPCGSFNLITNGERGVRIHID